MSSSTLMAEPSSYAPAMWHLDLWIPPPDVPYTYTIAAPGVENSEGLRRKRSISHPRFGVLVFGSPPSQEEQKSSLSTGLPSGLVTPSASQLTTGIRHWVAHTRAALGLPELHVLDHLRHKRCRDPMLGCLSCSLKRSTTPDLQRAVCVSNERRDTQTNAKRPVEVVAEVPADAGVADWEIRKLGHIALTAFLVSGTEALNSFLLMYDRLRYAPVSPILKHKVHTATLLLLNATRSGRSLPLETRVGTARQGTQLAQESLYDATSLGVVPLSPSYRAAVYLPLVLPTTATLLIILARDIRKFMAHRRHKAARGAAKDTKKD